MYHVTSKETTTTDTGLVMNTFTLELCPHVEISPERLFGKEPNILPDTDSILKELRTIAKGKRSLDFYRTTKTPEVFKFLRAFVEEHPDKYVYNHCVVDLVKRSVDIPDELLSALESAVYLAQREFGKVKKAASVALFLEDGYVPLKDYPLAVKGKVSAQIQDANTSEYHFVHREGRLVQNVQGEWFLLEKRRRNRGYQLSGKEVYLRSQRMAKGGEPK